MIIYFGRKFHKEQLLFETFSHKMNISEDILQKLKIEGVLPFIQRRREGFELLVCCFGHPTLDIFIKSNSPPKMQGAMFSSPMLIREISKLFKALQSCTGTLYEFVILMFLDLES